MARRPTLTDTEIDRLIVAAVGPAVVIYTDREGYAADAIDPECTERERAIWRAAMQHGRKNATKDS